MSNTTGRLGYRLVIHVCFYLLIFSILAGFFTYERTNRHELELNETSIRQFVQSVQIQAELATFINNEELAQEVMNTLLSSPFLIAVSLTSKAGFKMEKKKHTAPPSDTSDEEVKASNNSPETNNTDFGNGIIFPLFSPIDSQERIGSIIVKQNLKTIKQKARKNAFYQTFLIIAQLLVTVVVIIYLTRRIITRPIVQLAGSIANIKPGSGSRLTISELHANDEIGMISDTVNSFMGIIENSLAESEALRRSAEAASLAKSEFVADISHEIRTPMNTIIGFSSLALKTEMTPLQKKYMSQIRFSGKHLMETINDLLDFSRIETGKLDLENINFHLNDIISDIASIISVKTVKKGIELICNISRDVPVSLTGDPTRLAQVLMNIADNAVQFTQNGHIKIETDIVSKNEDKCMLKFSISDTGTGMNQEQIENLFGDFSQKDYSISPEFGKPSLALSISRCLVNMMGGDIYVQSEPGVGSTFSFTACFKLNRQEPKKIPLKSAQKVYVYVPPRWVTNQEFKGARILLVEDNHLNQQVAVEMMKEAGLVIDVAKNGMEAVEKVKKKIYDLVFMDIQMPIMGGYDATRLIRKDRIFDELPIVAMTAHAMEETKGLCLESGMNDYVSKPIDHQQLFSIISRWITSDTKKRDDYLITKENPSETNPAEKGQADTDELKVNKKNTDIEKKQHPDALDPFFKLIEHIPQLNLNEAMEKLNGNHTFYKELLLDFVKNYSSAPRELEELLHKGDLHTAERLVHNVNGVAALLCAEEIRNAAQKLETGIRNRSGNYDELISEFGLRLKPVMRVLEK